MNQESISAKENLEQMYGNRIQEMRKFYNVEIDEKNLIIESMVIIPLLTIWAINDYETHYRIVIDNYQLVLGKEENRILIFKD